MAADPAGRKLWVLGQPGMAASLVTMMMPDLNGSGLGSASMLYAKGTKVSPTSAAVTQALTLSLASNNLINLGGTAWPLSTMVFAVVETQLSSSNCSLVKELHQLDSDQRPGGQQDRFELRPTGSHPLTEHARQPQEEESCDDGGRGEATRSDPGRAG
jgi:hypothetical protein